MARFLLIHGAAHGAWCWHKTIPALQALGHRAYAIDLPSNGDDTTPLCDVTLDSCARAVLDALDEPSIVVGHSMGGYPITRAADLDPDKIERLVYLCAYVPRPGLTLADMRKLSDEQPLIEAIQRNPDGLSMRFDPSKAREKFYHDCSDEDLQYALERLCDQALAPQMTAFEPGDAVSRMPRSYITCEQDGAIPPQLQDEMASALNPSDRYRLNSSHSPFFSMPEQLAQLLGKIAEKG
ncbi:alpha/beta fold hydrolase [Thalassococcus lentus]|uniref:Alpha/beta fold hydrolase n=1 Tax=Thalassococcus lentus TaxID=1210524 RepID=A0ABT4XSL6_9RHOB|nr:alpha/beta fold hydrolase [Thalassococcus lentus]MDA7424956.1 alpha/beta fold hydrolase [Thalassococcus lentus]